MNQKSEHILLALNSVYFPIIMEMDMYFLEFVIPKFIFKLTTRLQVSANLVALLIASTFHAFEQVLHLRNFSDKSSIFMTIRT